jgi:hypothetical protein
MKIPSPATTVHQDKLKARLKAKRGIRAIDEGTPYDITGKMRWLARRIDHGDEGDITDVVVITRNRNGQIGSFGWGTGFRAQAHHMVSTVKNRLEPS